jgi:hypothetical protein
VNAEYNITEDENLEMELECRVYKDQHIWKYGRVDRLNPDGTIAEEYLLVVELWPDQMAVGVLGKSGVLEPLAVDALRVSQIPAVIRSDSDYTGWAPPYRIEWYYGDLPESDWQKVSQHFGECYTEADAVAAMRALREIAPNADFELVNGYGNTVLVSEHLDEYEGTQKNT